MHRMLLRRRASAGLALVLLLTAACGSTTDGSAGAPGPTTGSEPGGDEVPPVEAEAPGPWVPSRALAVDRFTLENALRVSLQEPLGEEFRDATVWTASGEGVDLRLELRSWFNGAEAEQACAAAAGEGAPPSLALGTPTWSTADAVYVTRGATCIRASVARSSRPDLAGASAVAEALAAE